MADNWQKTAVFIKLTSDCAIKKNTRGLNQKLEGTSPGCDIGLL